MGKLYLSGIVPKVTEPVNIAVGTIWLFTEDGTFTVPKTGTYQVELHGGGGGAALHGHNSAQVSIAGGGGSGEVYSVEYTKGQVIDVTIGAGGAGKKADVNTSTTYVTGGTGGKTTFGDLSITGGGGGTAYSVSSSTAKRDPVGGSKSGSLASSGSTWSGVDFNETSVAAGGEGNTSNTAQTYGDGGSGDGTSSLVSRWFAEDGKPGAVIVTFMGVR